jgi:hypothetical protein
MSKKRGLIDILRREYLRNVYKKGVNRHFEKGTPEKCLKRGC